MRRVETQRQAMESAWRIHAVLMDWTGKADAKAAVVLSLESAVMTAFAVLSGGRPHSAGPTVSALCYWTGGGLLVLSVAVCVLAVLPRLKGVGSGEQRRMDYIYFGHLKRWDSQDLAEALPVHEVLPMLARQLVTLSRVCWRKHRLVQLSIIVACAGTLLSAVSALTAAP